MVAGREREGRDGGVFYSDSMHLWLQLYTVHVTAWAIAVRLSLARQGHPRFHTLWPVLAQAWAHVCGV